MHFHFNWYILRVIKIILGEIIVVKEENRYNPYTFDDVKDMEETSNVHVLKGFGWLIIATFILWFFVLLDVFSINKVLTSYACVGSSFMLATAVVLCKDKADLSNPKLKYVLLAVVTVVAGLICTFLTYHAVLAYILPLVFAIQYRRSKVLWYTFVISIFMLITSCYLGFYYGLCDLNILIKSGLNYSSYAAMVQDGSISLALNPNLDFIIGMYEVFPRVATLLILTTILNVTTMQQTRDADRIKLLADTKDRDSKTKLYNKSKFEEMVGYYYPNVSRVAVIFWDMNNLKKTNDELGHDVGDRLINYMASSINAKVNKQRRAFRIGGDEFVMVLENPKIGEPDLVIHEVQELIDAADGKADIPGLSAAVGWAIGDGHEIRNTIKKADANMYLNKQLSKRGRS